MLFPTDFHDIVGVGRSDDIRNGRVAIVLLKSGQLCSRALVGLANVCCSDAPICGKERFCWACTKATPVIAGDGKVLYVTAIGSMALRLGLGSDVTVRCH